jgi:cyclophilin family peptidyl-prolyl cis-trans isomerase
MPKQRPRSSSVRHIVCISVVTCTALFITGCGSPSTSPNSQHLASIQSAVTCPAPPLHQAVTNPSRTFNAAPARVIARNIGYCAYIATGRGVISVRLRPEYAPKAVNDFVYLAQHGFYDGLTIYQVCPAVIGPTCPAHATAAVAGDPTGTGAGGPGYAIPADPVVGQYLFGAVAMYGADPASIGSQFFISRGDSSAITRRYDIFGQVTDGLPALALLQQGDKIAWVAVVATAPEP